MGQERLGPSYFFILLTYDGNPLGWRAHGRNARGQADHEELAHMVGRLKDDLFRVTTNLIIFRETGVLDRELNLASIPYMGSPEGLRHCCPPDHTSHNAEGVMISK